jgi:O-6-methylguanine DNA methyltransferase
MEYRYLVYRSPIGPLTILCGGKGIIAIGINETPASFKKRYAKRAPGAWVKGNPDEEPLLKRLKRALDAYFEEAQPLDMDLPLDLQGTKFQLKVWSALRKIPIGGTLTYSQVAKKIGAPHAARAVGSACRSNPIPLLIPCHRITAAGGGLGGYAGGIEAKELLLALEATSSNRKTT